VKLVLLLALSPLGCSFSGEITPNIECTNTCDDEQETCHQVCETDCVNADGDLDEACDTDCRRVCDDDHDSCSLTCTEA
jgi:hypothetical protein